MDLYLLNYNNYYNRKVKQEASFSHYLPYKSKSYGIGDVNPIGNYDFKPYDYIKSEAVVNWQGEHPDYVIVADGNAIESRWFVIEAERLRGGQLKLTLYRDLMVDFYEDIIKAPIFLEKGYIPITDSAIFNQEDITFNQIKQSEYLLKDGTKTAWIVGYCAESDNQVLGESIKFGGQPMNVAYQYEEVEDWDLYEFYEQEGVVFSSKNLAVGIRVAADDDEMTWIKFNEAPMLEVGLDEDVPSNKMSSLNIKQGMYNSFVAMTATKEVLQAAETQMSANYSDLAVGNILRQQNKIMKVGVGENAKYYRIYVNVRDGVLVEKDAASGSNLYKAMTSYINDKGIFTGTPNGNSFFAQYTIHEVSVNLSEISFKEGFTTTLSSKRRNVVDAPYCIFCIPYGDYTYKTANGTYEVSKSNAMALASGISTTLGGLEGASVLYDIQLLPYCPVALLRDIGPTLDLTDTALAADLLYTVHEESNNIIFYASQSSDSFNITYKFLSDTLNPILFKVRQQTDFWRICSPNYNGVFEFNPYKNRGSQYINIDYTYKPYQPYIHLNPNFGGLYGKDYDDPRGLICGGDFSLPIMEDAWRDFELSNKNYQNTFNRQVENMETNNRVQRKLDEWARWSGTGQAMISGGVAGGMGTNSAYGAIAGATLGGLTSWFAGTADMKYNEMLRNEALDYTKDSFGYQLGNIQALPNSLSRVSSFNNNNKIFPVLERYTATPEEQEAFKQKLIYNGMTIMRIGKLEDYLNYIPRGQLDWGFFKGQIIRFDDDFYEDNHMAKAIATEISKGVYFR